MKLGQIKNLMFSCTCTCMFMYTSGEGIQFILKLLKLHAHTVGLRRNVFPPTNLHVIVLVNDFARIALQIAPQNSNFANQNS